MSGRQAPKGCVTHYEVLNEIVKPFRPAGFFPERWAAAENDFGKRADGRDDFDSVWMMEAAEDLHKQLIQGERIACRIGRNGLEDVLPVSFGHKGSVERLLEGRVLHFDLDAEIFIREVGYVKSETASIERMAVTPSRIGRSHQPPETLQRATKVSLENKKDTENAWMEFIASYEPPAKPNRDERRVWYRNHGISRKRGEEIHQRLSPEYWKQTGTSKKHR